MRRRGHFGLRSSGHRSPVCTRGLEELPCPGNRASTSQPGKVSPSGGPEMEGRGACPRRGCALTEPGEPSSSFLGCPEGFPAPISHVGKLRPGVGTEAWPGSRVTHRRGRQAGLQSRTNWSQNLHNTGHRSQVIPHTKWRLEEKCRSIPSAHPTPYPGLRRRCGLPAHNSFAYTKNTNSVRCEQFSTH